MEEQFFDESELCEPEPVGIDAEVPAKNYFKRVNSIPLLTRAEESELIEHWRRFRDEKARNRVIAGHLRIPPAIARKAARPFEPNKQLMSADAIQDAWKGHYALIEELTAEGNLALVESVEHFDPARGYVFATYAGRCIRNAVWRRLRSFSSVVDRPKGRPTPTDIYIDPELPDLQPFDEYCGGRARRATPSDDDKRNEGDMLPGKYQRLRPIWGPEPVELEAHVSRLPKTEEKVIRLRMAGFKLKEVAEELGISTSTAWRIEQSARNLWNYSRSKCQETHVGA